MSSLTEVGRPPPIEHITQNYVPLKSLILSISERCGKELANILRTTENLPNDTARKDQFLRFIVACRQEYVKLYVLCKWAVVSGEISKAIDVANWLHGQVNCFNNVVAALYQLQAGLGPAKSPWADVETALQVLKYGHPVPTTEARLFIPKAPLSDRDVLRILRRLDVLIALRLVLHEHLPVHYRNYIVENGRARFHLSSSMLWVELSIADEEVATQCRFFYVNCGLSNGLELEHSVKLRIEGVINEQLALKPLVDVLDWLSMFAAVYKLQLLDRQLTFAESGASPWSGVTSHSHSPSGLRIRYFLNSTNPGETRISISPKAPHLLVVDPPLDFDLQGPVHGLAEKVLSNATKQHAARLISSIKSPWISSVSEFGISLELTPCKFTELTIDSTSGRFSLSGTGPLISSAQERLNRGQLPLEVLAKLRTQIFMDTIASRAEAVGWRAIQNVRLAPDELSKISPYTSLLALRLSNTSGWSLCVAMGPKSVDPSVPPTRWFATRLECSQRRWGLGPIHDMHTGAVNVDDPDYGAFLDLMDIYTKLFILFELMRELSVANVRHAIKLKNGEVIGVIVDITTILAGSLKWAQSGLLCTVHDEEARLEGRAQPGCLSALGTIKEDIDNTLVSIDGTKGSFSITTKRLDNVQESEEMPKWGNKLKRLEKALRTLHNAARSLASAASLNLEVRGATLTSLDIKYAEPRGVLSVRNGTIITFGKENPQLPLAPFLPTVGDHTNSSFGKIVTYLREWYPVWETLEQLKSDDNLSDLVILPQTMNLLRVQVGYDPQAAFLEISLRDCRRRKVVNFVTAGNGAENISVVSKWFNTNNHSGIVPLVSGCALDLGKEGIIKEMVIALANAPAAAPA